MTPTILFDLSIAGLGYSGIPQDTRCNFQALASATDFNVCGLLYTNLSDRTTFSTIPSDASPPWRKTWLQARYIEQLVNNSSPNSLFGWLGRRLRAHERIGLHYKNKVRLAELDNTLFFDVVWRAFLGKSLPYSEKERLSRLRYYISNLSVEAIARKGGFLSRRFRLPAGVANVLITPDARPIGVSRGTIKISRYHDIIPLMAPDLTGDSRRFLDRHVRSLRQCVANGDYFSCNSEATRADLLRLFPELATRTFVAHCIVGNGLFSERSTNEDVWLRRIVRMRRSTALDTPRGPSISERPKRSLPKGQPFRYALTVSTLDPKKNHVGMLRAFMSANQQLGGEYRLIIVGSAGWREEEILKAIKPLHDSGEVILLQSVTLEELRTLYSCASVFLFPSFYEGFGLPPAEAMKCGSPVVASDIAALREVLGQSAHYCDPYNSASITAAIVKALQETAEDKEVRIRQGQQHVERSFSTGHVANVWAENIRSILSTGKPCSA